VVRVLSKRFLGALDTLRGHAMWRQARITIVPGGTFDPTAMGEPKHPVAWRSDAKSLLRSGSYGTDATGNPSPDSPMGFGDHPFRRPLYLMWPSSMPIHRWRSDHILTFQLVPTNQAKRPFLEIMR
jgi:hypothetical protein